MDNPIVSTVPSRLQINPCQQRLIRLFPVHSCNCDQLASGALSDESVNDRAIAVELADSTTQTAQSAGAEDFAVTSTVWDARTRRFVLPYGFAQSPLLASIDLDMSLLGRLLIQLQREGLTLSVYVDDIIVSSDHKDPVQTALSAIIEAARESNYVLNESRPPIQHFCCMVSATTDYVCFCA